jgi:pimeloyl-ACP methyl ester carboxylesterase
VRTLDSLVRHRRARVNGVRLHYVEAGPTSADAPLILLLHGFPEFWYSWRHQIPALAAAGFHVIAPDLRGYNLSDKPPRVADYGVETLAGEVVGLINHAGRRRATLVGHDWGGVVAWFAAMHHPEWVEKLIILNAPHPAAYLREVTNLRRPAQLLRSWYAFFFQLPCIPEAACRAGDFATMRRMLRTDPARPGAFTADDMRQYVRAWSQPGALTASINYYRAAFRRPPARTLEAVRRVDAPTLLIWGLRDRYLVPALTRGLEPWVPNIRVKILADASHWVQHDQPELVSRLVIEYVNGQAAGAAE